MSILQDLSGSLAEAARTASHHVVALTGGTRFGASGILWQPGTLVTTRSTLRRDHPLSVTLPGGETVPAALAGHDSGTDVAVLTFEAPSGATQPSRPAPPPSTTPGEVVLAVGRSGNTGVNAVFGIVSAVGEAWQTWQGGRIDTYIRLDLTLYPGGSGAAVINSAGELVGMVSGALSRIAPLAIPSATIDRVATQLLAEGRIRRAWLGVSVQPVPLPATLSEAAGSLTHGLVVLSAEAGTPAARAGILVGDILLSIGGAPLDEPMDLRNRLSAHSPGESTRFVLLRGGERKELDVELGEHNGGR